MQDSRMFRLHADVDETYAAMVTAALGGPAPWREANLALRDAMVAHAARTCPYYREVAGPSVDFTDLPILTKGIIRARHDDLLSEAVPPERRVPSKTSGSADGVPLYFVRDALQGPLEYDAGRRFLLTLQGVPHGATMVWVATRPAPFPGLSTEGRPPGLIAVPTLGLRERDIRRLLRRLHGLDRWYFYGHPSALAWIAEIAGQRRRRIRPLAVITTAETLTPDAQRSMEEAFGCPVHSWYGSNEFNGFVMGTEPGHRSYVYNPLLVHAEVLDDEGRPAAPGETGRLVLTDLNNQAMPFLRYDTGDLATAGEGDDRPRVGSIEGRSSEVLQLEGGARVTPVMLGWKLFIDRDLGRHIRRWQCVQTDPGTLEFRIVSRGRGEVERELMEAVREVAGAATRVLVREVHELDRLPSGKAWVVRTSVEAADQRGASGLQTPQAR